MDLEYIQSIDSQNMRRFLTGFPGQWKEAMELSRDLDLMIDTEIIRKICFAGMGGSAMGADLLRAYTYKTCPYPVQVIRHYEPPGWVDEHTLFIACTYSGNTEETLTALANARNKGAQAIGVTSGGDLMLKAAQAEFDYIKVPGGSPGRAALAYNFVPLYRIFQLLGILDEGDSILSDTQQFLSEQNELLSNPDDNEALNLAGALNNTLPIIYSDGTMMEAVNTRWRSQFGENAKTLSYGNTLPEMNHNEIVGWERVVHLTGRVSVVMLRDEEDNPRVQQRMEIVRELIEDQVASLHVLKTRGSNRLMRLFSLVQLADWTSFYLAMLDGVDPSPVAKIDLLKSKLAEA
ncbi:MAG TPA: bifunctional phosphoglucose/phosphomannose isomerase [Balneolaceae bacterium]|nr:bifunctional phosphoglucose/phosphomannose isomerase [Balneolaceae bacterium]